LRHCVPTKRFTIIARIPDIDGLTAGEEPEEDEMNSKALSILLVLGIACSSVHAVDRVDRLIEVFDQEVFTDRGRLEEARKTLVELGATAVPGLFRSLDHPNINVRIWTESSLREMATFYASCHDSPHSPYVSFLEVLQSTDTDLRRRNLAISLLETLQHDGTMKELLPFLEETPLKLSVIRALGMVGDWNAVPPLVAEAQNPDSSIRCAVVEAISQIKKEGQSGTRNRSVFLQDMLQDSDPAVRGSVISAFYRLHDSSSIPSLLNVMVSDPDDGVQRQARMLIAYFITQKE
jgi:HEAT repeat protein